MRILHLGKFYYPDRGGIETVTQTLAEGMVKKGDEVTVICVSGTGSASEETISGVRVLRMPAGAAVFSQPMSLRYFTEAASLAPAHDIVHVHSPHPLAEAASLRIPYSIPVVVSLHAEVTRQKMLLPFYRPIQNRIHARATRILVSTQAMASAPSVRSLGKKVILVPYGVDEARFFQHAAIESEMKRTREKYGPYLLFIGRLVSYKGLEVLLKAAGSIPSRILIVGDGPLRTSLQAESLRTGVSHRVLFLGAVNDPIEFAALLRASEALVLPSITNAEAFGLVQIEAMACKKPCMVSQLSSGAAEVIENGVSGILVPPGNAEALAQAAQAILSDENRLKAMGEAAYERFKAHFTADAMINRTREIYLECLARLEPSALQKVA